MIILQNNYIVVGFSEINGSIILLKDKKHDITYINCKEYEPFRITTNENTYNKIKKFSYKFQKEKSSVKFDWSIMDGLSFHAKAELNPTNEEIAFTSGLKVEIPVAIIDVEYPIISNIESISKNDELAHPYSTGVLVNNPMETFTDEIKGFRYMPYPESFSGATMQFFSYYAKGKGGLYFAAYDNQFHLKWLNFYKNYGKLEASLIYACEDVGEGNSFKADWPFVIRIIDGDGWYESCDIYKAWAIKQDWCKRGPLLRRPENARWLYEDIGFATFGIDSSYDRTKWIKEYKKTIGGRAFHVLGPDWAATTQDYYNHIPANLKEWLPTRFDKENIKCIKEQGDRFAPFEFNFLVEPDKAVRKEIEKNILVTPQSPKSFDTYSFKILCPCTEYTRELHLKRDSEVIRESAADAIYYDISANNILMTCMNGEHNHPVGGGSSLVNAFKEVYSITKDILNSLSGKYIPMGTEMICEVFIDNIDFYQARAWAQPCAALETYPFRSLIKDGKIEVIPMFTYVYHEYGPLRLDGWGKLVSEIGEYFYYTVSKVYLWGGLYELNYEFSPMEVIDGIENEPTEHYYRFDKRGYSLDAERAAFLSQMASMRTSCANKYLAYGIMQHPLTFDNPFCRLDWYHYNINKQDKAYQDSGTIEVPTIVSSAWKYDNGQKNSLAFMFINIQRLPINISIDIDISKYELKGNWNVRLITGFNRKSQPSITDLGPISSSCTRNINLELPSHKAYMIEIYQ